MSEDPVSVDGPTVDGGLPPTAPRSGDRSPRLAILKALGDNTRYAIYLELARSPAPRSTAQIAESLDLHVNTVRPHLERMREVGLLDVRSESRRGVGRPQHLYSLAADAPSLGLEPSPYPTIARMLLRLAAEAGLEPDTIAAAGRDQGELDARPWPAGAPPVEALMTELDALGFDPEVAIEAGVDDDDGVATIAFAHCPFAELAESNPSVVCALHRGMVEGFLAGIDGPCPVSFHTLVDREPCLVEIPVAVGPPA
ncbi:helix-turn-helix transcriptional regulator [Actinomarinicola tropica]|uniref:helix-turn-helix transcriptional regulator n=1 Tax=Actinomarinicola tropica TaxID=2789776 RepID=UPI00189BFE57|nr:helix-turn-helix domain-containing protein [Actinomarinicola tropica]